MALIDEALPVFEAAGKHLALYMTTRPVDGPRTCARN
jgi:hypothetical protein